MKSSDAKPYKYVWRFSLKFAFLIGFYVSVGTSECVETGIYLKWKYLMNIYYVWRAFTQSLYLIFDQDLHWN